MGYQSIIPLHPVDPLSKAEPFKLWVAQVAKERLDQMQDPELSIEQAMLDYK